MSLNYVKQDSKENLFLPESSPHWIVSEVLFLCLKCLLSGNSKHIWKDRDEAFSLFLPLHHLIFWVLLPSWTYLMIRSPSSTYSLFNILEILLLEGRTSCSITNIKEKWRRSALLVWYLVLVPAVLRNSLLYTLDQGLLQYFYFCFCHLLFI